jgi:hypothetical protein
MEEVMLGTLRAGVEGLKRFLEDEYWKSLSSEKKKKFVEAYARMLQEEIQVVNRARP